MNSLPKKSYPSGFILPETVGKKHLIDVNGDVDLLKNAQLPDFELNFGIDHCHKAAQVYIIDSRKNNSIQEYIKLDKQIEKYVSTHSRITPQVVVILYDSHVNEDIKSQLERLLITHELVTLKIVHLVVDENIIATLNSHLQDVDRNKEYLLMKAINNMNAIPYGFFKVLSARNNIVKVLRKFITVTFALLFPFICLTALLFILLPSCLYYFFQGGWLESPLLEGFVLFVNILVLPILMILISMAIFIESIEVLKFGFLVKYTKYIDSSLDKNEPFKFKNYDYDRFGDFNFEDDILYMFPDNSLSQETILTIRCNYNITDGKISCTKIHDVSVYDL